MSSIGPLETLIVDDEHLARRELRHLLVSQDAVKVVGEAADADEAEDFIRQQSPDLILLDVQMPGASGFDLLERLDAVPHVVFVTAYDEYAIRAFEVSALDYLVKPVEPDRLAAAIETTRNRVAESQPQAVSSGETERTIPLTANDQVFVKDGKSCWFVQLADVRLFESAGNYTRLYFDAEAPLIQRSLNYLEDRLASDQFFRASRQHILNLAWLEDVVPWSKGRLKAILRDGTEVELSRRRSRTFRDELSL